MDRWSNRTLWRAKVGLVERRRHCGRHEHEANRWVRCQQTPAKKTNDVAVNTPFVDFVDDQVSVGVEELGMIRKKPNAIASGYKPRPRLHPFVFSHSMAHPEGNLLA